MAIMNEFKEKISKYNGDFVFLIGNGINKFMNNAVSWNDLLMHLIRDKGLQLPESLKNVLKGDESKVYLTFPEIFSLANIEWEKQKSRKDKSLKKEIVDYFNRMPEPCKLLNYAACTRKNIITTNYDFNIEKVLKINTVPTTLPNITDISKKSPYYYLFECFTKVDSAKVWHIHGHCRKPGSIKIGIEDYSNTLSYVKSKLFRNGSNHINPADGNQWYGFGSCLGPFVTKPLVIAGCSLQSDELLLRQLLLYNFHARNTKDTQRSPFPGGIYLSGPQKDKNKKAFLESLGFSFVEFENYSDIYNNDIWNKLSC